MKIFLFGAHWINAGPDNVNQKLINEANEGLLYLKSKSKYIRPFETAVSLAKCDIIILSGICSPHYFNLLSASRKKMVYLMHGDICFENNINNENSTKAKLDMQDKIFQHASKIVCVSEMYSKWVKDRYPQYKSKITFVNNGLSVKRRPRVHKEPFSIAVAGGNRPIKANKYVCEAVKILSQKGIKCKVYVFGRHYSSCEELPSIEEIQYMGHLNKDEYYEKLDKISTFIMNSDVEPFGLTIADAINCNCSLLMSRNIGAISILKTKEEDVVDDNHNPEEIAEKIIKLQETPNVDRLYETIDMGSISSEASYRKLMGICESVKNDSM